MIERAWFGLMALGGLAFGLIAERRPFGDDFFAHPFVLLFIIAGAALLALRLVAGRPVPQLLADRALALGSLIGAASFLAGDWIGSHWLHH